MPAGPPKPAQPPRAGGRRAGPADLADDGVKPHPPQSDPPPRTLRPPPTPPNAARLRALVAAWAPVLRLHPNDTFRPCTGPWFAARSALTRHGERLLAFGATTLVAALAEQAARGRDGLRLALDPFARPGQPLAELDAGVPLYARAQLAIPADGGRPALEITYLALYAYNGPYAVAGFGPAVGAHDGDWERWTARLDAESGELTGAWYNAHRPRDGCWLPAARLPLDGAGRPSVYVAKHGHGVYPTAGTQARAFLMANDVTSGAGPTWRPRGVVLLRAGDPGAPPPAGPGAAPELGRVPCRGCEVEPGGSCAAPPRGLKPRDGGEVAVRADDAGVGDFMGLWGECLPPRGQGWWARSECPVSRGVLKRLFLEPWPEAD